MIQRFDKATCKALAVRIETAVQKVAEEYGITIRAGGGTFTDGEYTAKLRCSLIGDAAAERAREEWERHCYLVGMHASDFGRSFEHVGQTFTIVGFALNRSKFPIIAESNGKRMLFTAAIAKRLT